MLNNLYEKAVDWLKYAESKNAVLIAFNGTLIAGISFFDFMNSSLSFKTLFQMKELMVAILLLSVMISMISFIPVLSKIKFKKTIKKPTNIFFFKSISNMTTKELIKTLNERYDLKIEAIQINTDLADQVIINCELTVRKLQLFTFAIYIDLFVFFIAFYIFLERAFNG